MSVGRKKQSGACFSQLGVLLLKCFKMNLQSKNTLTLFYTSVLAFFISQFYLSASSITQDASSHFFKHIRSRVHFTAAPGELQRLRMRVWSKL